MQEKEIQRLIEEKRKNTVLIPANQWREKIRRQYGGLDKIEQGDSEIIQFFDPLPKDAKILEWGMGAGKYAIPLAKRKFQVFGFDIERLAVQKARRFHGGRRRLNLAVADVRNPPLRTNARFDGVLSIGLMHLLQRQERGKFIDELKNRVKEGGRVFLVTQADEIGLNGAMPAPANTEDQEMLKRALNDPRTKCIEYEGHQPLTEAELRQHIEMAFPKTEWEVSVQKNHYREHYYHNYAHLGQRVWTGCSIGSIFSITAIRRAAKE